MVLAREWESFLVSLHVSLEPSTLCSSVPGCLVQCNIQLLLWGLCIAFQWCTHSGVMAAPHHKHIKPLFKNYAIHGVTSLINMLPVWPMFHLIRVWISGNRLWLLTAALYSAYIQWHPLLFSLHMFKGWTLLLQQWKQTGNEPHDSRFKSRPEYWFLKKS